MTSGACGSNGIPSSDPCSYRRLSSRNCFLRLNAVLDVLDRFDLVPDPPAPQRPVCRAARSARALPRLSSARAWSTPVNPTSQAEQFLWARVTTRKAQVFNRERASLPRRVPRSTTHQAAERTAIVDPPAIEAAPTRSPNGLTNRSGTCLPTPRRRALDRCRRRAR
jgi:hypothetical protein